MGFPMRIRLLALLVALTTIAAVASPAMAAPKKSFVKFSPTAYSVTEGGSLDLTIARSGNTSAAANVTLSVATGSTTAVDYIVPTGTISFAANQTKKTVHVTTADNSTFDGTNKIIKLHLAASGSVQVKSGDATVTILENDGPGTIDFTSATYDVVEGAGVATVSLTRNSATNISSSVHYTTTALPAGAGNATAGVDYMTSSGTATFAPGAMVTTFQVPVLDDSLSEANEVLNLGLSAPTSSAGTPNLGPNNSLPATLTILDDDSSYSFSSSLYAVHENEASGNATITVNRDGVTNVPSVVHYATSDGSATQPGDYTATSGDLSFAAGETSKTFDVPIVNDGTSESTENINLTLSQPGPGGDTLATSLLQILDNDNPAASVQLTNTAYSAAENGGTADITITLSHPVDADVTVNYSTVDALTSTATPDSDYTAIPTTGVVFVGNTNAAGGVGETTKTIHVPILQDTEVEGDETFDFSLGTVSAGAVVGTPSTATVTISDDDLAGNFEFDALRYDVNEAAGQATFTVRRVGGSSGPASVDYSTNDGTAHAPGDFTSTTGTLNFADGELQKTFVVPIAWDGQLESDESLNLQLANPSTGSDLANNAAAVVHIGDDGASGPISLSATAYNVNEADGSVTITATRTGGSLGGPVSADYTTSDGSASAGSDYTATSGTLTFGPGETTTSFTVPIVNDSARESAESFQVTLSNAAGGASLGSPSDAAVRIADDDDAAGSNLQSSAANPNPAGSQTAANDTRAPKLKLTAKKVQNALKLKLLALVAKCDENCSLSVVAKTGKGKKAIMLAKASAKTARGQKHAIKVKLNPKALAKLAQALKGGKARVTITVIARDAAGNKSKASRSIIVRK